MAAARVTSKHLVGLFHVRALRAMRQKQSLLSKSTNSGRNLKPDDDGKCQVELFGGVDDALRDDVTFHDASEDVDQNSFDFGVALQNLEGFANLPAQKLSSQVNTRQDKHMKRRERQDYFSLAPPPTSRKLAGFPP